MHRILLLIVVTAVTLPTAQAVAGNIQMPRLFNPPPPRQQVAEAQIWDPYPTYYAGHPDSTRPRDFFYGPPEATIGRYPAPGTFPRSEPWMRSQAPADYPNLRKRFLARQAAKQAQGQGQVSAEANQDQPPQRPAEVIAPPPAEVKQSSAAPPSAQADAARPTSRRTTRPKLLQPPIN